MEGSKPITLDDLREKLRIEMEFTDWDYGESLNELKITILFDREPIHTDRVYIDPAGYERK